MLENNFKLIRCRNEYLWVTWGLSATCNIWMIGIEQHKQDLYDCIELHTAATEMNGSALVRTSQKGNASGGNCSYCKNIPEQRAGSRLRLSYGWRLLGSFIAIVLPSQYQPLPSSPFLHPMCASFPSGLFQFSGLKASRMTGSEGGMHSNVVTVLSDLTVVGCRVLQTKLRNLVMVQIPQPEGWGFPSPPPPHCSNKPQVGAAVRMAVPLQLPSGSRIWGRGEGRFVTLSPLSLQGWPRFFLMHWKTQGQLKECTCCLKQRTWLFFLCVYGCQSSGSVILVNAHPVELLLMPVTLLICNLTRTYQPESCTSRV